MSPAKVALTKKEEDRKMGHLTMSVKERERAKVLERYPDFRPTLAAEKMAKEGIR